MLLPVGPGGWNNGMMDEEEKEEEEGSASGNCVYPRVKVPQVRRQSCWSSEVKR